MKNKIVRDRVPMVLFKNDPDSGLYRIDTNNWGLAINGALVADEIDTLLVEEVRAALRKFMVQKEQRLTECIRSLCGGTMPPHDECQRRGHLNLFPDGTEIFEWDGQSRLTFGPVKTTTDAATGKLTISCTIHCSKQCPSATADGEVMTK